MVKDEDNMFLQLGKYKNIIARDILDNVEIAKALTYPVSDFLDQPTPDDAYDLINTQVYALPYIPNFKEEQGTFLTFDLNGFSNIGETYKAGMIDVNISANIELWDTDLDINRIDYIGAKVYGLLHGHRALGIGTLQWVGWNPYRPENTILGITLSFAVVDFQ